MYWTGLLPGPRQGWTQSLITSERIKSKALWAFKLFSYPLLVMLRLLTQRFPRTSPFHVLSRLSLHRKFQHFVLLSVLFCIDFRLKLSVWGGCLLVFGPRGFRGPSPLPGPHPVPAPARIGPVVGGLGPPSHRESRPGPDPALLPPEGPSADSALGHVLQEGGPCTLWAAPSCSVHAWLCPFIYI